MKNFICLILLLPFISYAQPKSDTLSKEQSFKLRSLTSGTNTSIRGLSVVSDQVAWVSGSNGFIGKTTNGGLHWEWVQPQGYENLDFRDIEAFDEQNAVAVNAGSPAYILLTTDGGKTWKTTYKNMDAAIFLDGMDFWDRRNGIIFGDPIHNQLQILSTNDGGQSWKAISNQLDIKMQEGEASFAASGTTIKTLDKGKVWIATGGAVANIYHSNNYGQTWVKYPCPIWQGENSTGPFSIDFFDAQHGIVVGGNYLQDKARMNNALVTNDGGATWLKPHTSVFGYRSGVLYLHKKLCVAVGTSGVDISKDGGLNWVNIAELGFHAVKKAKKGKLILLAGPKGTVYSLTLPKR
ncbi:WD40/YVTN/BNR-like repeat-containing protein [Pedobacter immunditicola]|uniref:WD40/YVTN/BNR-like repeat-containing protein n=1 Tax=Pedobacter immunditicola TaxID=3133440 RepID=UPI0030B57ED6